MFSPFVASLANLSGYFDQLLVLATLGAVMLVATERPLWAGLVCVLAVLSHEMFALFGLPVVAFTVWLHAQHAGRRGLGAWLALGPPVLALACVAASEHWSGEAVQALMSEVEATRAIPAEWTAWGAHALTHDVRQNLGEMGPRFLERLVDPVSMWSLHPTTVVMGLLALSGAVVLTRDPRQRGVAALTVVAVIVAPWGIALLGWDWTRFLVMAQFHAHVVTLVLVATCVPLTSAAVPRPRTWTLVAVGALGLAVTVQSLTVELPRVAANDEDERPFALHTRSHFACTGLLFRNSNFAAGSVFSWVRGSEGVAFRGQPLVGDLPARRGAGPARPFHEWIGTAERHGDRATGSLESPAFEVSHDQIAFRIGGGHSPDTYVRLVVDGREQHRAGPRGDERLRTVRWNVVRLRGRRAQIELVDQSESAHLNVEGFCYSR